MITTFEEITHELSNEELDIIPIVVHGFKKYTKENTIKAEQIVTRLNEYLKNNGYKIRMTQPRLRKMVNYIRTFSLIPLIATSNGYFTSDCKETIQDQVKSLQERASSILRCAEGMKKFLEN
jgi:hypothetical protein